MKSEKYSTFKILAHEELNRLYALPIDELKSELDQAQTHLYRNKDIHPKHIEPNRPFYVQNGNYYAIAKLEGDQLFIHYLERTSGGIHSQDGLVPLDLRPINASSTPEEVDERYVTKNTVDFTYLDEYERYDEIYKVHYNRSTRLYSADPNCNHEIEAQWSGIKCIHCRGWYCA